MVQSYKQKFNIKYKQDKNKSNSIQEIAKLSGYKLSGLKKIVEKGEGAFFSNPKSVRPNIQNATAWGMARLYSSVMGGKAAKIDKDLLKK
tara:strand:- start:457 stop:726 length:270 start_codon:yes stop_codon:yes gene_type:complete